MATQAKSAQGTVWQVEDASVFTAIPEVIRGDTPGITSDVIDVTNHDSPSGVRENIAGYKDTDEVTWEGNYIVGNAVLEFLQEQQLAGLNSNFKVMLPGTTGNRVNSFNGVIRAFRVSANTGEQLRYTMTLKPSGPPTWGAV